jgi:nitrite reductase/ring-hydroxylating ferredoxin subunit
MWLNTSEAPPTDSAMKEVRFEDINLVIANIDNQLYCFENRCPHEDFKLSLGCIKNNQVKCPLHGYEFNLSSGVCLDEDIPPLNLYPVKEENGLVVVQLRKD